MPPDGADNSLEAELLTDLSGGVLALNQCSEEFGKGGLGLPVQDELDEVEELLELDQPVPPLVDLVEQVLHFFYRLYHPHRNERVLDLTE